MRPSRTRYLVPLLALTLAARTPVAESAERSAPRTAVQETWTAHTAFYRRDNCGTCTVVACGHVVPIGTGDEYANPHSDCIPPFNCEGHPPCSVAYLPEADKRRFTELVDGAVNGSMDAVENLLRDFGQVAELNTERSSLQIRGCDTDSYIANIPLTPLEFASASQFAAQAVGVATRN